MIENTQRGVLKRPGFLLGLAISILSMCGIVLAAATLISLRQTPDKLLTAFREQHGQVLNKAGVSADLIASFVTRQTFRTNALADLPEEQRRAFLMIQEALPAMATAVRQAAQESRTKSQWGIAISGVLLLLGVVLLGRESRRAKMKQTGIIHSTMKGSFTPIGIDEYVELYLSGNRDADRDDLIERLHNAIAARRRGERCRCGQPIWVIGSAEAGLSCFTCVTGESHPDKDYEIDVGEECPRTTEHGVMKRTVSHCLFRFLICLLFGILPLLEVRGAELWRAGVARVKITPEEPIWMSGYASRDHPAEGTRTDLWAKALALEDARGNRAVLITLDLVGIHREMSHKICNAIMRAHGIERGQIVINASHTHTGPVIGNNLRTMYFMSDEQAEKVDRYSDALPDKLTEMVARAFRNLQPAALSHSEGQATFAANRRNNPEGQVPDLRLTGKLKGPVDYRVPVLRIANERGALRAVVFGYACHATTMSDYLWSGDYPGHAQQMIEEHFPGVTAMFWAGCGADINPIPRRNAALAERYGKNLAEAVDRALHGVCTEIDPAITWRYREIELPFDEIPSEAKLKSDTENENRYIAARAKKLLDRVQSGEALEPVYPYPISVWKLGTDLRFIALGGEVVVDYSLRLARELGPHTWVAGYSHDVMAYIPSKRVWNEGGYEGGTAMIYYGLPSRWGPKVEEIIIGEVERQVKQLSNAP